jgi:hypothetical protein
MMMSSNSSTCTSTNDKNNSYREVVTYIDGRDVVKEMAKEYLGVDYDLLRKNCCTFARDACLRLGVNPEEIPSWFRNLAHAGAATQDVAYMTLFQPITSMLSYVEYDELQDTDDDDESVLGGGEESQTGFEIIANEGRRHTVVNVVDTEEMTSAAAGAGAAGGRNGKVQLQRTLSWTY